jgi:hypothetical protein
MSHYATYILHIWRSRTLQGPQWVARLECPTAGERRRFADPEALLSHLRVVENDQDSSPVTEIQLPEPP